MFLSTEEYLHRITHALENVVAPLIESDFARGQLLAAVYLLDQLTDRIDYRAELIREEIETCCHTIRKTVGAIQERGGLVPGDLKAFVGEIDVENCPQDRAFRSRCEEKLSIAIDSFYANRKAFDPESAHALEGLILGHLIRIGSRNMAMYMPSTSQKLLDFRGRSD